MNNVFISHSAEDKESARSIAEALDEVNLPYWLDEQSLLLGADITATISDALDRSSAAIFLLSKDSSDKPWLSAEIALALSKGKKVFPILLNKNTKIPILLQQYAWLDISESKDYKKAAAEIAKSLASGGDSEDSVKLRLASIKAKKDILEWQKEIYEKTFKLKEIELKSRSFSLSFISLCVASAGIIVAFGENIEEINFLWAVFGIFLGAAAAEVGHLYRRYSDSRDTGKEAKQ